MAGGAYPRPCIAEMGGKNACVVTARGDLERAATGIVRSAFGLTGQKCSALSRVYVEDERRRRAPREARSRRRAAIRVGDPCRRENWMGPVINEGAAESFERYCARLRADGGRILAGGDRLRDGDLAHGHFVAPDGGRGAGRTTRSSGRRCSSRS